MSVLLRPLATRHMWADLCVLLVSFLARAVSVCHIHEQTWRGHSAIVATLHFCFRVRIPCCIFKRGWLKVEWCWKRRQISHFLTLYENQGRSGRDLWTNCWSFTYDRTSAIHLTNDDHPLRGCRALCIDKKRKERKFMGRAYRLWHTMSGSLKSTRGGNFTHTRANTHNAACINFGMWGSVLDVLKWMNSTQSTQSCQISTRSVQEFRSRKSLSPSEWRYRPFNSVRTNVLHCDNLRPHFFARRPTLSNHTSTYS